jgi:hypothetical protein
MLSNMLMLTERYRRVVEFERPERPEMEMLQWRHHTWPREHMTDAFLLLSLLERSSLSDSSIVLELLANSNS